MDEYRDNANSEAAEPSAATEVPKSNRQPISKANALKTRPREYKWIRVPEWGGDVCIRSLYGEERDAFEETIVRRRGTDVQTNTKHLRARFIAWTVVEDEGGALMFSEDDIPSLSKQPARVLDRIFAVAQALSGMSDDDVDQLAGNYSAGQNGDSGSLLPKS